MEFCIDKAYIKQDIGKKYLQMLVNLQKIWVARKLKGHATSSKKYTHILLERRTEQFLF